MVREYMSVFDVSGPWTNFSFVLIRNNYESVELHPNKLIPFHQPLDTRLESSQIAKCEYNVSIDAKKYSLNTRKIRFEAQMNSKDSKSAMIKHNEIRYG